MPPGGSGYHLSLIPYIIIHLIDLGSFWIHDSCRYPYKTSTQLKYLRSRLSTEANVHLNPDQVNYCIIAINCIICPL